MGVDAAALREIFNLTTGVWTIAAVLMLMACRLWNGLPAVMAQWIAWRRQRQEEKDAQEQARLRARAADWDRLRGIVARLDERVAFLERERTLWMDRAIRAEAIIQGQGEVRQAAANASAEVRLDDAERRKGDK